MSLKLLDYIMPQYLTFAILGIFDTTPEKTGFC